jgi:Carboxypeptidase regulatory-like domain
MNQVSLRAAYVALVVLGILLPCASAHTSGDIRLAVTLKPPLRSVAGEFIARKIDDPDVTRVIPFTTDAPVSFTEAAGSRWGVSVRAEGAWSLPQEVVITDDKSTKDFLLWPAGTLTGRVQTTGVTPPAGIKVLYLSIETPPVTSQRAEIPSGTRFECPVDKKARFSCVVPATRLDVAIGAPGYAPHYQWDVKVDAGRSSDLQTITLKKGSSLLAWLAGDATAELESPATGRLYRAAATDAPRLSSAVAEARSDVRGAFQFRGLAAGTYTLVVTAEGWAPAGVYPIEIREGGNVVLRRPITLERPLELRLQLQPASERMRAWTVDVRRLPKVDEAPSPGGAVRATPDAAGQVVIKDLSPGTFRVVVEDGQGNSLIATDLHVRTPGDANQVLDVKGRTITGKVTLGKEPLEATLMFGGRSGAIRVKAASSEDGRYEVFLPDREYWIVDIDSAAPRVETTVSVTLPSAGDTLDIEVSTASIAGRVVSPAGEGVAGASIRAFVQGTTMTTRANALGEFRFTSIPPGTVGLIATTSGRTTSRRAQVTLKEGEQLEGVRLETQATRMLRVQLMAHGTPLAGARVGVHIPDGRIWKGSGVNSGVDGAFEITIPADLDRLRLFVGVPGLSFQPLEVAVSAEPGITVNVPVETGGTLRLTTPADRQVILWYGTISFPLSEVVGWIREHGGTPAPPDVIAPNLASGQYRICAVGRTAAQPPNCKEGLLTKGGTLALDLSAE